MNVGPSVTHRVVSRNIDRTLLLSQNILQKENRQGGFRGE